MQLFQWGRNEKRIQKHIQNMKRGEIVKSTEVSKALNLTPFTAGKIIAILFHERQINVKRIKDDPSGHYLYEVL